MYIESILLLILSFLYPLIFILSFIIPSLKRRFQFERKNLTEPYCYSFKKNNINADICFEISSEGELEQIRYPLIEFLEKGKNVELIFCSPSVEKNCIALANKYSNLRILRFPLLSFSWFFGQSLKQWMTAPRLVLCRYDFFPELMYLAQSKNAELWEATLRGKKTLNFFNKRYYEVFETIYCSTPEDVFNLKQFFPTKKIEFLELRFLSIKKRLSNKDFAIKELAPFFEFLKSNFKFNLVLGNFWLEESLIFTPELINKVKEGALSVTIFPHLLDPDSLSKIKNTFINLGLDVSLIPSEHDFKKGHIYLVNQRGVLIESYSFFDFAYVGGGFGRSIHSVLEPYVAGCDIIVGPKVYRSTEYLLAKDEIYQVFDFNQIAPIILNAHKKRTNAVQNLIEKTYTQYEMLNQRLL